MTTDIDGSSFDDGIALRIGSYEYKALYSGGKIVMAKEECQKNKHNWVLLISTIFIVIIIVTFLLNVCIQKIIDFNPIVGYCIGVGLAAVIPFVLLSCLIIWDRNNYSETLHFHSVEHKLIDCLQQGISPTIDNLEKMEWLDKNCGSAILAYGSITIFFNIILITFFPFDGHHPFVYLDFLIYLVGIIWAGSLLIIRADFFEKFSRMIQGRLCLKPNIKHLELGQALGFWILSETKNFSSI